MKEAVEDLREIRDLITQAERALGALEGLLPPKGEEETWLKWRIRTMERKLRDAKRELKDLVDRVQVAILEPHMKHETVTAKPTSGSNRKG